MLLVVVTVSVISYGDIEYLLDMLSKWYISSVIYDDVWIVVMSYLFWVSTSIYSFLLNDKFQMKELIIELFCPLEIDKDIQILLTLLNSIQMRSSIHNVIIFKI